MLRDLEEVFYITVTVSKASGTLVLEYEHPILLSQVLIDAGIPHKEPCGGKGRCGKCLVIASGGLSPLSPQEAALLSEEDWSNGLRLACQTEVIGNAFIQIPERDTTETILTQGIMPAFERLPWGNSFGIAVDIGTTTVAAYLYALQTGILLAECSDLNPQSAFGADVISRIEHALAGEGIQLKNAIAGCINGLTEQLCAQAKIETAAVSSAVITGNTTMLFLLCGEPVGSLATAPFLASRLFGEFFTPSELGLALSADTRVYLPKCISAFVGGDMTTGMIASGLDCAERPTLLVDIGTNGEMILCVNGRILCCSTAAGPAFEGAGIRMGSSAVSGAVSAVTLQDGALRCTTIGDAPPATICGSGIVDALAAFLDLGVVDETGRIEEEIAIKAGIFTLLEEEPALQIKDGVLLTQKDIRTIQLAKAAICAGMNTLLHHGGISEDEVDALYIAGGFGSYMNVNSAERIGLIIPALAPKAKSIGNAAGVGAAMLLQSSTLLSRSEQLAERAETIDLSSDAFFMDRYIECMMFGED